MAIHIGKGLEDAYKEGKIQHPSQATIYIDHVCEQCGHYMSYPHWVTNGYMCIRCGCVDKDVNHA